MGFVHKTCRGGLWPQPYVEWREQQDLDAARFESWLAYERWPTEEYAREAHGLAQYGGYFLDHTVSGPIRAAYLALVRSYLAAVAGASTAADGDVRPPHRQEAPPDERSRSSRD